MNKVITSISKDLYEQLYEETNGEFKIIEHYGLTKYEVLNIVREWYTNGMYEDILQNEDGKELCEILIDAICLEK